VIKADWQLACLELLVYGVLDLTISTVPAGACSLPTYNIQIKKIEKFTQMKVALTLSLSLSLSLSAYRNKASARSWPE